MTEQHRKTLFNVLFYLVIGLSIAYFVKRKFVVPKLETQKLELHDYKGNELHLQDFENKVLVLNFWQTWCGPCREELPSLNEMNTKWEDIQVLAISDESLEKVAAFKSQYPNILFVHVDDVASYGITQFPSTYILNKEGVKVYSKIGSKFWSDDNFIATLKKNWE